VDITKIMATMEDRMKDLGGVEKAKIFDTIFGKKAIIPAMVLMNKGSEELAKFAQEIRDADGSSKEMAATMRDTTMGSMKALQSAVESVVISLFKLKDGALKGTIDGMVKWVRENEKLIASGVGDFIKNITENFDKIITAIKTVGTVVAVIWGLSKAIMAVNAVLTLTNLIIVSFYVAIPTFEGHVLGTTFPLSTNSLS